MREYVDKHSSGSTLTKLQALPAQKVHTAKVGFHTPRGCTLG